MTAGCAVAPSLEELDEHAPELTLTTAAIATTDAQATKLLRCMIGGEHDASPTPSAALRRQRE